MLNFFLYSSYIDAYVGYFEKKWKLFTRKLPKIMYYTKFLKNTLRHVKTTTLYLHLEQELNSDEMFYKACVPLGDVFWR